jgi:hypothetical protein
MPNVTFDDFLQRLAAPGWRCWAKLVQPGDPMDTTAQGGYAVGGSWRNVQSSIALMPGEYLVLGASHSETRQHECKVLRVCPEDANSIQVVPETEISSAVAVARGESARGYAGFVRTRRRSNPFWCAACFLTLRTLEAAPARQEPRQERTCVARPRRTGSLPRIVEFRPAAATTDQAALRRAAIDAMKSLSAENRAVVLQEFGYEM